jgi:hypothetical protein
MTFTFGEDLTVDRDYVRFHCADTIAPGFMSDALIASLVTVEGTTNKAVITGIRHIIGLLSRPDFRADWLQVSNQAALAGYKTLLAEKKNELGIGGIITTVTHVYRADSDASEEPDWDD